ncbi:MAG: metallophosphoesterase [Eubacterium sp.]|nr:metallophosphoesterase [Eubacterium sp.]
MKFLCSDIHGDLDKYMKALDIVGDNELIIVGDVIDRGDNGLDILLDTMNRDNVTLMMGNHEGMMLDFLFGGGLYGRAWLNPCNGGEITCDAFMKNEKVNDKALSDYLSHLPVSIDFGDVFLVHGMPVPEKMDPNASMNNPVYRYKDDYPDYYLEQCLWKSLFKEGSLNPIQKKRNRKTTYYVGHVITQYAQDYYGQGKMTGDSGHEILAITAKDGSVMYNLDGGCAMCSSESYLLLYCLDTSEVTHIR